MRKISSVFFIAFSHSKNPYVSLDKINIWISLKQNIDITNVRRHFKYFITCKNKKHSHFTALKFRSILLVKYLLSHNVMVIIPLLVVKLSLTTLRIPKMSRATLIFMSLIKLLIVLHTSINVHRFNKCCFLYGICSTRCFITNTIKLLGASSIR